MTSTSRVFSGSKSERERWFIAFNRFGLGAKLGQIDTVQGRPEDWLLHQMEKPSVSFPSAFPTSSDLIKRNTILVNVENTTIRERLRQSFFSDYNQYVSYQLRQEVLTTRGFDLRVLNFFSNHFSVSKGGRLDSALAPSLEIEAIAPNIFGSFDNLLLAVAKHPTMIRYLDNEYSFGPNSKFGIEGKQGLNENLAREILELHTMGVDGTYSQKDVEALARGITGWSIKYHGENSKAGFDYKYGGHEPGNLHFLGKSFANKNIKQGEAMLRFIAKQESTAQHICSKIVSHFVSPSAPISLINKLVETWHKSDGDLKKVFERLIKSEETWVKHNSQYKQPRDYVISVLRALPETLHPKYAEIHKILISFGQGPFMAGSPAGFEQDENYWNNPTATINKIDWVNELVHSYSEQPDLIFNSQFFEELASREKKIIYGAETRQKALLFFLISPCFMRR